MSADQKYSNLDDDILAKLIDIERQLERLTELVEQLVSSTQKTGPAT